MFDVNIDKERLKEWLMENLESEGDGYVNAGIFPWEILVSDANEEPEKIEDVFTK